MACRQELLQESPTIMSEKDYLNDMLSDITICVIHHKGFRDTHHYSMLSDITLCAIHCNGLG